MTGRLADRSPSPGRTWSAPPGRLREEDGFTIVEFLVAMLLVTLFFLTFTTTVVGALRGARDNRLKQTATVVVTEHLESVRTYDWVEVAMTDVNTAAPLIDEGGTVLLADDAGLEADEELVVSVWGLIPPVTTEVVEETEYTVWSFVSEAPRGMKRVTVFATWEFGGDPRTSHSSTLVAEAAGGSP